MLFERQRRRSSILSSSRLCSLKIASKASQARPNPIGNPIKGVYFLYSMYYYMVQVTHRSEKTDYSIRNLETDSYLIHRKFVMNRVCNLEARVSDFFSLIAYCWPCLGRLHMICQQNFSTLCLPLADSSRKRPHLIMWYANG